MTFEQLRHFILSEMQMSHVYQPVMLRELLKNNGQASVRGIAQALLNKDPTQLEYFSEVVKRMVGKVLTNNRGITEKNGDQYVLKGVNELTSEQISELIRLCEDKISEFEKKRGISVWSHRRRGHRPISGSIRYEVLKLAQGRCELCGVANSEKALEVDHILPKSLGGKDDISNYQALCYSCNASKRNTDDTDFRALKKIYADRIADCLFCDLQSNHDNKIILENSLAYAIVDDFPVSQGHTLFIPKRHSEDYFGLVPAEVSAINHLLKARKNELEKIDPSIGGFNIGMNCGQSAGQTIFHSHIHLIPRRRGDVDDPRGGVRHVVPGKGFYESK
jgi:diadenosine tetraphosphate (Ap4A) HIT family hydrolase